MSHVVPIWLALLVVGCTAEHAGSPTGDSAPREGRSGNHSGSGTAGNDATSDDRCIVQTAAPRTFPDDGPCDDTPPVRGEFTLEPVGHYVVTCDPQPLDAPGCKGVPNDAWNTCALRRCAPTVSYPKGCFVTMPTGNPHWVNNADTCECLDPFEPGIFRWTCAL